MEANTPPADPPADPPAPVNPPGPPPPAPPAAPPPAAATVLNGEKTERDLQLEKDLAAEREARKKVELDNAQLQDQLHRLKATPPADPKPHRRGPLGVRV